MFEPIFPGMDPFIEDQRWGEFHGMFITEMRYNLGSLLIPQYSVEMESYIQVNMRPDVSIFHRHTDVEPLTLSSIAISDATRLITPTVYELDDQRRIEIRDGEGNLITVIELLSPANKGRHRDRYLAKRDAILSSDVHLVEIDLLRGGERMEQTIPPAGYAVMVARSRENTSHEGALYEIGLRDPLPVVPVPLLEDDPDVPLNLPGLFRKVYTQAHYRLMLDYTRLPALGTNDLVWITDTLNSI